MKPLIPKTLAVLCLVFAWTSFASPAHAIPKKKIVLLAGPKSHGPGSHEYIKSVRLIKVMLDHSNVKDLSTEVHLNGWPEDASTLDDADVIVTLSDGYDGVPDRFEPVPWTTPERLEVIERQMNRGCGFVVIHFSTFFSDERGKKTLDWGGGYFDWEDERGEANWYSSIKTITAEIGEEALAKHPIANGVRPFTLDEEFYYNIRFGNDDHRLVPILKIDELESDKENGKTVAWAVERQDGGRGFSTTMGHAYNNWKNDEFRKLLLNGIVWAAGIDIPQQGVESQFYDHSEVTQALFGKAKSALILTGHHHPGHEWELTTPILEKAIEDGSDLHVDVSTDIEDLQKYNVADYSVLVMNYCNWEDSAGLSDNSKQKLVDYLKDGGGFVVVHFANGAFHNSLPNAGASDWPEFRQIVPRVWDHNADSSHDRYGEFTVRPTAVNHPITKGIQRFQITDELYFNQKGEIPIEPLLEAKSNQTHQYEPLAWTHHYGEGRVFQTVLGHSPEALANPSMQLLIRRGAEWAAGILEEKNQR